MHCISCASCRVLLHRVAARLQRVELKPPEPDPLGEQRQRVHVVGDLHGQLADLLHILDDAGMPSAQNAIVFNGDFVDRGPDGVEVRERRLARTTLWMHS